MHPIEKRSLKHKPFDWLTLFLEMAMIIFSILLALNLESWREGRREREQARIALQNISSEIRQNRKSVLSAIPLHHKFTEHLQETIAKLDALEESGVKKEKSMGIDFELRPPHLYQTAWQTILSTQSMKRTDYQTILTIAELYEMQRWMSLIEEKILQAMLAPGAFDPKNLPKFLTVVYMLYRDYTGLEEQLVGHYDGALKRIASQAEEK
jgi:type II secretory pathway pseudopilin PulG